MQNYRFRRRPPHNSSARSLPTCVLMPRPYTYHHASHHMNFAPCDVSVASRCLDTSCAFLTPRPPGVSCRYNAPIKASPKSSRLTHCTQETYLSHSLVPLIQDVARAPMASLSALAKPSWRALHIAPGYGERPAGGCSAHSFEPPIRHSCRWSLSSTSWRLSRSARAAPRLLSQLCVKLLCTSRHGPIACSV